jgi:hypothetical protein
MAFLGSSFNLWLDSGLTSPFSGVLTIVNETDLSDNPQDFTFYLGSVLTDRQLEAASSPGVDNIVLTPTDTLPIWAAASGYVEGNKVQPIGGNGFVYRCSTTGTSGGSEPTWPVTPIGATVADGTCVWTLVAAHHPITEIKLSLTSGAGLTAATGGAALNVATTITGGTAGAIPIYMRITNTVTTVSNDTGNEEIGVNINSCIETEVP